MCTVFPGDHLGCGRCRPARFRYGGKKGRLVDYRLGAFHRIYHLPDFWIQKGQKDGAEDIDFGYQGSDGCILKI